MPRAEPGSSLTRIPLDASTWIWSNADGDATAWFTANYSWTTTATILAKLFKVEHILVGLVWINGVFLLPSLLRPCLVLHLLHLHFHDDDDDEMMMVMMMMLLLVLASSLYAPTQAEYRRQGFPELHRWCSLMCLIHSVVASSKGHL